PAPASERHIHGHDPHLDRIIERAAERIEQPQARAAACPTAAALLAEDRICGPLALEHCQHGVLRFDVGLRGEIACALLQALQLRPDIPAPHGRPCLRHRDRYLTVVHTSAPKVLPINASLYSDVHTAFDVRMWGRTLCRLQIWSLHLETSHYI